MLHENERLRAEVHELQTELAQLRNSSWFRLRERLLPQNSFIQRLYLALRTGSGLRSVQTNEVDYGRWCEKWDTIAAEDREAIFKDLASTGTPVLISVVMPVFNAPAPLLEAAVDSLRKQLYPRWELCIVDDASTHQDIKRILERHAQEEPRIKVAYRDRNGHISEASNTGLSMASGEYVAFMDQDDLLPEHALYTVAKYIERNPGAAFLYSDEDRIDERGKRRHHHFKPEWDPYLLLATNYCGHLCVFKTEAARRLGLRRGFEGAQDWDLILRYTEGLDPSEIVHMPHVLYHWRAHEGSTASDVKAKPYVAAAQLQTVQEALTRRHEAGTVRRVEEWDLVRCYFQVPEPLPLVSLIVPTRNREDLLEKCTSSLFSVTEYLNYEVIIVDNGSDEPATLQLLDRLGQDARVRVLRVDAPFNFSALNNLAAAEANGSVLTLLNNDIEIVESSWLQRLVSFAVRSDVGAVGPRLLYPDRRVQHGGVVIGNGGVAGHAHLGIKEVDPGYNRWAVLDRTVSAVTAACLALRSDVYQRVGGLNEEFAVSFNDIDFCLRIGDLGLRNIYAGSVTCIHNESASRGAPTSGVKREEFQAEVLLFRSRWRNRLRTDPYYSPNLSLDRELFTPDDPRVPLPWRSVGSA